jgi:hypothetical protein
LIQIDGEMLAQQAAGSSSTTISVRRGLEGTVPAAHASSAAVATGQAVDFAAPPLGEVASAPSQSLLRQATVTLTHTQILTLDTTRQTIVPAAGPTTAIIPIAITLLSHFVTAYGTTEEDDAINIDYNGGLNAAILVNGSTAPNQPLNSFLTTLGDRVAVLPVPLFRWNTTDSLLVPYHYSSATTSYTNRALTVDTYLTTPLSGGDAANTLTVSVLYGVYDVALKAYV